MHLGKGHLGTGHKVFTRGCGGYFWGVRKKTRTSEGGTKKTTEPLGGYQNLNAIGTEENYIL